MSGIKDLIGDLVFKPKEPTIELGVKRKKKWFAQWKETWKLLIYESETCEVCGGQLEKSSGQRVKYCSKECRLMRHNKRSLR